MDPTDLRGWLTSYSPNYEGSSWAGQNGNRARAAYRYDNYSDGTYTPGNSLGRRTEMWDISGHTRWTYDQRGCIITEEKWIDGHCYVTQWTYDAMDRVLTITYPRTPAEVANQTPAEVVSYVYNAQLLLQSISSSTAGSITNGIAYNVLGLPTQVNLSHSNSNLYLNWTYLVLDYGASPYGALGNLWLDKGGDQIRLQHSYDPVRNLTRFIMSADNVTEDFTFIYDEMDRLTTRQITNGANQETFGYNQIGNITNKNGQSYAYGSQPHAVTNDGTQTYLYDANGNMVQRGTSQYLKYDTENRLAKVSSDSNGWVYVARMAYDGDGKRAKRVDNFGAIHYAGPHYERNVGTGQNTTETVTRYYYAQMGKMKRLIAINRSGTLYYVVPDHLGGTLRTVNTDGSLVDNIRYNAFGSTRSGGTNTPTDKRFTGQTLDDASTGLYDYGARAYDCALGRFLQPDTVVPDFKNPQGLNRYSYGHNNPVRYSDPTGHDPVSGDPNEDLYYRARGYVPEDGQWVRTHEYTAVVTTVEEAVAAAGDAAYVLIMLGGVGTQGYEPRFGEPGGLADDTASNFAEHGNNNFAAFSLKYNAGQPGDSDIIPSGEGYSGAKSRGYFMLIEVANTLGAAGKTVFAAGHSRGADIVNTVAADTTVLARTALFSKPFFSDQRVGRTQKRYRPITDVVSNGFSGSPLAALMGYAGALIPDVSKSIGHGSTMSGDNSRDAAGFFSGPLACY